MQSEIKTTSVTGVKGFSLIELMLTLTIISIIAVVATPSFITFVKNARIERESQDIYGAINQTKQLAFSRGRSAFICRSTAPDTPSCSITSGDDDWDDAKLVYSSTIGMSIPAPSADFGNLGIQLIASSETAVVRRQMIAKQLIESPESLTVKSNENHNVIAFSADGIPLNDTPFRIAICDDRDNPEDFGKYVEINRVGRLQLRDTSSDTGGIDCDGDVVP